MAPTLEFTTLFLQQYQNMLAKVGATQDDDTGEIDQRYSLARNIVEGLWGYDHDQGDFDFEALRIRADIPIYDKDGNKVIVIETKRTNVIDSVLPEFKEQAFGYADAFTEYILLTNHRRFILYRNDPAKTVLADITPYSILMRGQLGTDDSPVTLNEEAHIAQFSFLAKSEIWDAKRFDDFTAAFDHRGNVGHPHVISDLAETLKKSMEYLYSYALKAFQEYDTLFATYSKARDDLVEAIRKPGTTKDPTILIHLTQQLRSLELEHRIVAEFKEGYRLWETLSQRIVAEEEPVERVRQQERNREVFCKESAYVLLNKVLFVRICEDKGLLPRKLSNGGIGDWRRLTLYIANEYKDLLRFAFLDAVRLYETLYLKGIFDWYLDGNSRLNEIIKRVLWFLNHYDFATVNDDILGSLYEAYLTKDTRRALGEFYTPRPIVEFILDSVGWASGSDLRGKTLLDMGCGSGTFLVSAVQRFFKSLPENVPPAEALDMAIGAIYGFDIDPFATHICEMNLLFQVLDRYREVKQSDPERTLRQLNVYNTDSLEIQEPHQVTLGHAETQAILDFLRRKSETDKAKETAYDFIVGNPPYVTHTRISPEKSRYYRKVYARSIYNRPNLYRLFIHRASQLLPIGGRVGYIVANTWIADKYARALRRLILEEYRLVKVVPIPERAKAFFDVTQATTILILEKKATGDQADYELSVAGEVTEITGLHDLKWNKRRLSDVSFGEDFEWAFVFHSDDRVYEFVRRLKLSSAPKVVRLSELDDVIEVQSGEVRQSDVPDRIAHAPEKGAFPTVVGKNVDHFYVDITDKRVAPFYYKRPDAGAQLKRDDRSLKPRIVVQRIINQASRRRIIAGMLDPRPGRVYVENGVNYVLLREKSVVDPYYLIGLLNSSTLDFFARIFNSSNNLQPHEIERLPVCLDKGKEDQKKAIAAVSREVEFLERTLQDFQSALSSEELMYKGIPLVGIYQSPLIRAYPPSGAQGAILPKREGIRVHVGLEHYFECQNEAVAVFLVERLMRLNELEEVQHMHFPKDMSGLRQAETRQQEVASGLSRIPAEVAAKMRKLDALVFDLYELSADVREMISSTPSASLEQPLGDDALDADYPMSQ